MSQLLYMRHMQSLVICLITVSFLLFSSGCHKQAPYSSSNQKTRCLTEVESIPEMTSLVRSRNHDAFPSTERPIEGLEMALTINGMIRGSSDPELDEDYICNNESRRENFDKIINALKETNLPPTVAFVSGRHFDPVLGQEWIRSGQLIGSLTFSRSKATQRSPQEYIADISRNEDLLSNIWTLTPGSKKYFRYPRLKASQNIEASKTIQDYLQGRNFITVPATIDGRESKFTEFYCAAVMKGDRACIATIKMNYLELLKDTSSRARKIARDVSGSNCRHIMMIEANQFSCDNLLEIINWLKNQGVRFIPLEEALRDPFYSRKTEGGEAAYQYLYRRISSEQRGEEQNK